jgi:hypothetical protein
MYALKFTPQEEVWNSTAPFETIASDGTCYVWVWTDKTGTNTWKLQCRFGERLIHLVDIIQTPHTKTTVSQLKQRSKVFQQPQHPPIDFDVPCVLLDPDAPDYAQHLKAISRAKLLVLDLETFGATDFKNGGLHPWDGRIRLIQLFDGETVWIADLGARSLNTLPLFASMASERDTRIKAFAKFLEVLAQQLISPDCRIVGHCIHFDLRMLATQFNMRAQNVACTLMGTMVYFGDYGKGDEDEKKTKKDPIFKGGYGLGNIIKRWFNTSLDKGQQQSDWGNHLASRQIEYAAHDAIAPWHLYHALLQLYKDKTSALYSPKLLDSWEVENQCIPVAVDVELAGMPVDLKLVEQHRDRIETMRQMLLLEWEELCPDINYNQVTALAHFLEETYGIKFEREEKLNKRTGETEEKITLDKTALAAHVNIPLVKLRLQLKALDAKLNNVNAFARSAERDGRVHTTFRTLTGFGRFSSGESKNFDDLPNLQSVAAKENPILVKHQLLGSLPLWQVEFFKLQGKVSHPNLIRYITKLVASTQLPNPRECIKRPPGYAMAVVDLAGAHGRIAADQANDETAIAGNNDSKIDNHSKVAVYVAKCQNLDWTWEDIAKLSKAKEKTAESKKAKSFRDTAKNTYYGWLNGAGAKRIQAQITANTGKEPKLSDCEAAIEGCKVLYPKVLKHREALHKRLVKNAVEVDNRMVAVNSTSDNFRILQTLVANRNNPEQLEAPYTQSLAAIWTRIEATAVKKALPKIQALIKANPDWDLQIIGIVHDEVDCLVKEEFAEPAITNVNNLIGDEFKAQLKRVVDGRETNWKKLLVNSWADK